MEEFPPYDFQSKYQFRKFRAAERFLLPRWRLCRASAWRVEPARAWKHGFGILAEAGAHDNIGSRCDFW